MAIVRFFFLSPLIRPTSYPLVYNKRASQPASRARETHQLNFFSSSSSCYAKGDSISLLLYGTVSTTPVSRVYITGRLEQFVRSFYLIDERDGRECGAQQKNIKEVRRRRKRKEKLSIHRSSASCVLPTLISEPYST